MERRVSVADGKRDFTRLLREAREQRQAIVIVNQRVGEVAGALLSPEDYERFKRMAAYFEAERISEALRRRGVSISVTELVREARAELGERGR